jgi:biuret amidohydrolase
MTIESPETFPEWFMPWPSFQVDWSKSALVVIDYQNYGSNPDCGVAKMLSEQFPAVADYYVPRLETTIANTQRLLTAFRKSKREIVFTRHGALLSDGRDMIARRRLRDSDSVDATSSPTLWSRGSFEHEIVAQLAPEPDELVIDKNASSAFNGTGIDQLLRNMELQTLVIAGMATDMCVETTARDAADRGYQVIVVDDACATFFPEHHNAALSALARVYTQVWSTDAVLTAATGS